MTWALPEDGWERSRDERNTDSTSWRHVRILAEDFGTGKTPQSEHSVRYFSGLHMLKLWLKLLLAHLLTLDLPKMAKAMRP